MCHFCITLGLSLYRVFVHYSLYINEQNRGVQYATLSTLEILPNHALAFCWLYFYPETAINTVGVGPHGVRTRYISRIVMLTKLLLYKLQDKTCKTLLLIIMHRQILTDLHRDSNTHSCGQGNLLCNPSAV
jgi:hypothetical protein